MMVINGSKIEEDMIMKNIFRISALMCAMAFLTTSCVKDELFDEPQQKPAAVGDEIIFGSRAGFENSDKTTRTVYSGETYKVGTATFERIDWVDGVDKVQIYCDKASNVNVADYFVYDNSNENVQDGTDEDGKSVATKDEGYLVKVGDSALQWGSDTTHTFYAMYPATSQFDLTNNTLAQGIKMDGTTLKGIVPSAQRPKGDVVPKNVTVTENGVEKTYKAYVAEPNMDYAYMAAKATATRDQGAVSLDFVPIVTALEIQLVAHQETKIKEIMLSGKGLSGGFEADLGSWKPETTLYPTCTNKEEYTYTFTSDTDGEITTTLSEMDNIIYTFPDLITLQAGDKLEFTVFLRPGSEYSNLTIGFSETGAAYKNSTIGDTDNTITIPKHKKTKISGINLPKVHIEWDASDWMSALPDDREMRYLSLPGTGGSYSYNYNSDTNANYYKQQTLTFEEQWKAGIRAFEMVVDRREFNIVIWSQVQTLAGANLTCNKQSVGKTFGDAMNDLISKVTSDKSKEECAVVIITYQPESNDLTDILKSRNANKFAQSLKIWYDELSDANKSVFIKYTPELTMKEARGHIMVLVRINQQDEKDGANGNNELNTNFSSASTTLSTYPFVLINGCGTAKDRWGARGYKINDTEAPHISNSKSDPYIIENYMNADTTMFYTSAETSYPKGESDNKITRPEIGSEQRVELNFDFETETGGVTCWYQEWARVVETSGTYNNRYWFESLNEKKSNIKQTFNMAISSDPTTEKTIFVNSLCGYIVTDTFSDSSQYSTGGTYGGSGGDIKRLALGYDTTDGTETTTHVEGLNAWFEAMVNASQLEYSTGPTGIIMMDYVEATDQVIGTIISNNFKYSK